MFPVSPHSLGPHSTKRLAALPTGWPNGHMEGVRVPGFPALAGPTLDEEARSPTYRLAKRSHGRSAEARTWPCMAAKASLGSSSEVDLHHGRRETRASSAMAELETSTPPPHRIWPDDVMLLAQFR
jgi:hypothetical protein